MTEKNIAQHIQCQNCFAALDVKGQKSDLIRCDYCGTDNMLGPTVRTVVAEYTHRFSAMLCTAIADSFSDEDELRGLVIQLNGELPSPHILVYEHLSGANSRRKSMELVMWCQRRGLLQPLVDMVISLRPGINLSTDSK